MSEETEWPPVLPARWGVSEGRLGSHLPGGEEKPKIDANIFWLRRSTNSHLCGMAASQALPSAGVRGVWYRSPADFFKLGLWVCIWDYQTSAQKRFCGGNSWSIQGSH